MQLGVISHNPFLAINVTLPLYNQSTFSVYMSAYTTSIPNTAAHNLSAFTDELYQT
jgi:hypothetical protein